MRTKKEKKDPDFFKHAPLKGRAKKTSEKKLKKLRELHVLGALLTHLVGIIELKELLKHGSISTSMVPIDPKNLDGEHITVRLEVLRNKGYLTNAN